MTAQKQKRKRGASDTARTDKKTKVSKYAYDDEESDGEEDASPTLQLKQVSKIASDDEESGNEESGSEDDGSPDLPYSLQTKQDSVRQPVVYALTRQALCETLPDYKAHEAAAHTRGNAVYGVLVDGGVSPRDIFNENVIITTIGGGRVKCKAGGAVLETSQPPENKYAQAYKASMVNSRPVVVIVGRGNTNCKVNLKHYYNVLGHFHVTHVWYDKYRVSGWMVKLQRVDVTVQPWWSPLGSVYVPPVLPSVAAPVNMCTTCRQNSTQIYTEGWTCMYINPAKGSKVCERYFDFGRVVDTKCLKYLPAFLQELVPFQGQVPAQVAPLLPDAGSLSRQALLALHSNFKQGYVCPSCGCCSRRVHMYFWACENKACGLTADLVKQVISVQTAKGTKQKVREFESADMNISEFTCGGYSVKKWLFPNEQGEVIGFVCRLRANDFINSREGGPDDLFASMQQEVVDLTRNPVRQVGKIRETVTKQFARNFGAPYKHVAVTESESFEGAPDYILRVLRRNSWAAEKMVTAHGGHYVSANELLSLGYMKAGSMNYHDDGEKVLGETVTSLSLGGSALMHFRPKARTALFGPALRAKDSGSKKKRDVLVFELQHGDIMVMHGLQIQKLYEHTVKPTGSLRYALTSRTILFDKIDGTPEEKKIAAKAASIPARAEKFNYDGDHVNTAAPGSDDDEEN